MVIGLFDDEKYLESHASSTLDNGRIYMSSNIPVWDFSVGVHLAVARNNFLKVGFFFGSSWWLSFLLGNFSGPFVDLGLVQIVTLKVHVALLATR